MSDAFEFSFHQKVDEMIQVMRQAVRKAQEESRQMGVPNVYRINGQRYYELPNGDYVRELPKEYETG